MSDTLPKDAALAVEQHRPAPGWYWIQIEDGEPEVAKFAHGRSGKAICMRTDSMHWMEWEDLRLCVRPSERDKRYRVLGRAALAAAPVAGEEKR
jgi:hypothetical protein